MQELLIVNPAKRPSKRRKSTTAASPAQKRARAAFAAMARARAKNPAKRRKSAKRRTRKASTTSTLSIMKNPKRRSGAKRRAKARRRNPIGRSLSIAGIKPMSILVPALTGAIGATVLNTIMSKLPLPASLTTGRVRYLTQGAAAIAMAAIAQKLGVKGAMAVQAAEGALTVTLHQAITDFATGFGMNLSGMGYYLPGRGVQAAPNAFGNPAQMAGMGKYLTGPGAGNVMQMPVRQPQMAKQMRGFNF